VLPLLAGLIGGAMNALAGGGTFATMPALIALGLPSPIANATSNVALLPGAATSAWTYRRDLERIEALSVRALVGLTLVGGTIGSLLLVATPTRVFDQIIPWLLLFAAVVLIVGRRASDTLRARVTIGLPTFVVVQLLLAIYGGYFGGGVGLMMTATYGLIAGLPPHRLAAARTLQLAVANAAASVVFVALGRVAWGAALPMIAGAAVGGWLGARLGNRLPPAAVRAWTIAVTVITTAVFFWRAYG
jgi:uncharacterized membrane protein YfcA